MRTLAGLAVALAAVAIAGCEHTSPLQPGQSRSAASLAPSANVAQGKPEIDPTYANGTTVYMIGPHLVVGAKTSMPNLYAHAEELYLVVYPQATVPAPGAGPITLASGYQPQCNPCFHPGLPAPFVYHDHVITGAPGMGISGTAGAFKGPWKIILLMYDPGYANSPTFTPIKSAAAIDSAETAGGVFLPINPDPNAENKFEIETGNVLICPLVSNHA